MSGPEHIRLSKGLLIADRESIINSRGRFVFLTPNKTNLLHKFSRRWVGRPAPTAPAFLPLFVLTRELHTRDHSYPQHWLMCHMSEF